MATAPKTAIVPIIPTAAMIAAGNAEKSVTAIWAAMVAAAGESVGTYSSDLTELSAHGVTSILKSMRVNVAQQRGCDLPVNMLEMLPPVGSNRRNPDFWSDLEVRRLVVELHRQVTVRRAAEIIKDHVGPERTPGKSSITRAWKRLDLLAKSNRGRRK